MELIGRQREVAEVATRLRDRRLVTVIGPAGIGKTALALSVTREVAANYELGAHVVDLTRVDSAQDVAGAIAAQLGFGTFYGLINSPSEQPALVVVDNCEHVGRPPVKPSTLCWPRAKPRACWLPAGHRWTCPGSRW